MGCCQFKAKEPSVDCIPHDNVVRDVWKRYTDVNKIGEGGFAHVFSAIVKETHEPVVVKMQSKLNMREAERQLFQQEVTVLKQLHHPGIVEYKNVFEDEYSYALELEFLQGKNLLARILELNHYSEKIAQIMVRSLLETVLFLHSQNIVHLDIKNENLVFAKPDDDTSVTLIDFGFAIHVDASTAYRNRIGTPIYMAPEMEDLTNVKSADALKKCDIYSLGVVMFTMLIGAFPRFEEHKDDLIVEFPKTSEITEESKELIRWMLQIDPKKRCTAEEALQHVWLKEEARDDKISEHVILGLQKIQRRTAFQKAIIRYLVCSMNDKDANELKELFERYDEDGSGAINVAELANILMHGQRDIDQVSENDAMRHAQSVMKAVDINMDGTIDEKEFARISAMGQLASQRFSGRSLFDSIDRDNDGQLTIEEFRSFLRQIHEGEIAINEMFESIDVDGDGTISFEEFITALKYVPTSQIKLQSKIKRMSQHASLDQQISAEQL